MDKPIVVHQDSAILVISKPSGLVVNRAQSVKGFTIQDWLDSEFDFQLAHDKEFRNGVVHRLDKDTSGILLIAKKREYFMNLSGQFARRTVKKEYLGLVHGKLQPKRGDIRLPLARSKFDRERFSVKALGKASFTEWEVIEYFSKVKLERVSMVGYQGFSLVKILPKTGRTHQIRVHLAHLKHPIVGDARYTGRKRAREDQKWCKRQFLHAARVRFLHPETRKRVTYEAELPSDLKEVLSALSL